MRILLLALCFLTLSPLAAFAVKVEVDWDESVDFRKYQTWAWLPGSPAASEFTQKRIESNVERVLEEKGLRQVEEDPDLWVTTHASSREKRNQMLEDARVYAGAAARIGWGGYVGIGTSLGLPAGEYTEGTVLIELRRGATRELLWQAVARNTLTNDGKKNKKEISKAIERSFRRYPPETERSKKNDDGEP